MNTPSITPPRAGAKEWLSLVVLILAVILLAIDGTVLYMAVPALTADLAPTATQILWVGDIYSFVLAGLLVTMGNVADRVGRKRLLLIGSMAFGLASVLAAFAPSAEVLIAARALLGIAGATIMPSTLSIIRNLFHDSIQRTKAIAFWSAGAMAGGVVGPLVGGALLESFWWGSVFLINVPVIGLVVVLGIWLLPESKNPHAGRIDLLSAVLSVLAIVPVVYAIKHAIGQGLDWSVLASLLIGALSGWLFVRRQRRLQTPLVDISLFRIPAFNGAVASNTLSIFAFFGLLFFFSQYLQLVRGYSPFWAGMAEMPATIASVAVIAIVGFVLSRLGLGRAIAAGLLIGAIGLATLGLSESMPSYVGMGISLGVIGLGTGLSMTLSTDAVVSAAPPVRAGAAASIAETAYELGIALGIGVLGSIQTAIYRASLHVPAGTPPDVSASMQDSLASTASTLGTKDAELLSIAQDAFTHGMQITAFVAAVLLVVAAFIAWRLIPSTTGKDDSHAGH
ncbi:MULTISPECIES: MFS transporter [unclassified Brevibacterium]|uniref:MFS transporter n=1 Tax=unclassified Brevibacterium TaxID=2614124 RepID=UPI00186860D6|nr:MULTISPECIES: MFS transporter [unclassified Brevibacterium]